MTASAAEVAVTVRNDAAPTVWFASPSDGDRLPAGREVTVRVRGEGGEELTVSVNGSTAWTAAAAALDGRWTPGEGAHRLVAVASAPGRPDAVASIEVTGVAPAPAAPVSPGAAAPLTPGPRPGAGGGPHPSAVPAAAVRRRVATRAPAGIGAPPASAAPAAAPPPAAGAGGAARAGAGPGGRDGGDGGAIAAFLRDPERVAWGVGLPLLLIAAGAGYLLLQRFIDGGPKLAWRGRGRPDDTLVEF